MASVLNLTLEEIDKTLETVLADYTMINPNVLNNMCVQMWEEIPDSNKRGLKKEDWVEDAEAEILSDLNKFCIISPDEIEFWDRYTHVLILEKDNELGEYIIGYSRLLDFAELTEDELINLKK